VDVVSTDQRRLNACAVPAAPADACPARGQRARRAGAAGARAVVSRRGLRLAERQSLLRRQGDRMAIPTNPTDAELDAYILFRFAMLGIDISVLPVEDDNAQVDQVSVLESCRSTLRQSLQLLQYELDVQKHIATYYASPQSAWTTPGDDDRQSLRERKLALGY
jgi:hypothetical protein